MLATEPDSPAPERGARPTRLEDHRENERMRHIPDPAWLVAKLEGDLRDRIEKLWVPFSDIGPADPRHAAIEAQFRAVCRGLDRIADIARRTRGGGHPPSDLGSRIRAALAQAVTSLNAADPATFGKRLPFHTFERSSSEPLWGAFLSVIDHLQRIVPLVREIEPDIDERLYEGLVRLSEPLRREPIA